ncbi:hypothetical protein AB1Y20_018837 [Prymnesium parvum]|uniref:Uncharacterized protein n=1 Tax=Prymnesium parvum TaxID=97485 RepID=A0AB34JSH0_PRYPA
MAARLHSPFSQLHRLSRSRRFHIASSQFDRAFDRRGIPAVGADFLSKLRAQSVSYIESFDPSAWSTDPVSTLLHGAALRGGAEQTTVDAFGQPNGLLVHATDAQLEEVVAHLRGYVPPRRDYRKEVRALEAEVFALEGGWPAFLVGNQAIDFKKQDGLTEIEEAVQANEVERRLLDLLLEEEAAGRVEVGRAPAYVGCVSNFSNFLDLCRKGFRNLEAGVPLVILSRSNTTQHMYRWTQMLLQLMPKHGIDLGMVTYVAASKEQQAQLFSRGKPDSPAYYTCSRAIARTLTSLHGGVVASTGGPNTLVATRWTPAVAAAVRLSAAIENAGQCTALRHAVVNCSAEQVEEMLGGVAVSDGPAEALRNGEFGSVFPFAGKVFERVEGYEVAANAAYRVSSSLPPDDIKEQWRQVYVDVTSPGVDVATPAFVDKLCQWLVAHQPITVAVNADDADFALAKRIFEQTAQVVFTVGSNDSPALTCQARPQDGEVFGELPVRRELAAHTKFPVFVPTPTPGYNTSYASSYLTSVGHGWDAAGLPAPVATLAACVSSDEVRGYMRLTAEYLLDACAQNPKVGANPGGRTALYGLQTTPRNGQLNYIRCGEQTRLDDVGPHLLPFVMTNAWEQVKLSVAPGNAALATALEAAGVAVVSEAEAEFEARVAAERPYNVILPSLKGFPLVGQFTSLLLCVGHIKSVKPNDQQFIDAFRTSPKWLSIRTA